MGRRTWLFGQFSRTESAAVCSKKPRGAQVIDKTGINMSQFLARTRIGCHRFISRCLRHTLRTASALALAVAVPQTILPTTVEAADANRPNIVLIMADDMGFECVGANGSEHYRTPELDRLATGGMRFAHAYSQPICTPSRVQIMTGRYNFRNYVQSFYPTLLPFS